MADASTDPMPYDPADTDQAAARDLVQGVVEAWHENMGYEGVGTLRDHAHQAMAEEATHRLRQVLAEIEAHLELAAHGCRVDHSPDPFLSRYPQILKSLDRTTRLLETYLEAHEVIKQMVDLDTEPFDLAQSLTQRLELADAFIEQVPVEARISPVFIEGDQLKLLDVLMHLISRFQSLGQAGDAVEVHLSPDGAWAHGFVGLRPGRLEARELVRALGRPADTGGPRFDVIYARAVVERHGGSMYVERTPEEACGFGFDLPLISPDGEQP